jgi:RNA polymerase sigma factor (sigma-70 family)
MREKLSPIQRCQEGDERAFAALVEAYSSRIRTLVRFTLDRDADVDDVVQDTFAAAWRDLPSLHELDRFGPWLFAIARNRCRDAMKGAARRERATDDETLTNLVGHAESRSPLTDELHDAVRALPRSERDATRLFYFEGLTVREIAQRHGSPTGTVKRQLHDARRRLRRVFGADITGEARMSDRQSTAFPQRRPHIQIDRIAGNPFTVDCPELRWWHIVPRVGEAVSAATYRPPAWDRDEDPMVLRATRAAEVHGVEGVEIDAGDVTLYARATDDEVQYLATTMTVDGKAWLRTFLDEGYNGAWGTVMRHLEDMGAYVESADGSLTKVESTRPTDSHGVGVFRVRVGDRAFDCLRVLQLEGDVEDRDAPAAEAYISREGRTILLRCYCQEGHEGVVVDTATRLVIDGVPRFHWYDVITDRALA